MGVEKRVRVVLADDLIEVAVTLVEGDDVESQLLQLTEHLALPARAAPATDSEVA